MNVAQIDTLNDLLPGKREKSLLTAGKYGNSDQYKAIDNFVDKYTNLAYGWYAAREFAKVKEPFPVLMSGRDKWVFKAYLYQLNPREFRDRVVEEAYALSQDRASNISRIVKALLVVPDVTFAEISIRTGIKESVIEAFSTLFYNIQDRRDDHAYLAQAIYPDTRFVTLREGYFENASISDLLVRAGYESGSQDAVSFMAGLRSDNYIDRLANDSSNSERLEGKIMANAINLAAVGLVNQKLLGLQQSRALMVADKQGGIEKVQSPVSGIAGTVLAQLTKADSIQTANMKEYYRSGEIVDV